MNNHFRIAQIFSIISLICFITGCSHNKQSVMLEDLGDYKVVPVRVAAAIDSGNRISVVNLKGSEQIGRLIGVELQSVEEYNQAYHRFRSVSSEPELLPSISENIVVTMYPERGYSGSFVGFDYGSVICIRETSVGKVIRLKLETVRSIKLRDDIIKGKYFRKLTATRIIPYRTVIKMKIEDTEINIPINQVRQIKVYQTKDRWTGLLLNFLLVVGFSILSSAIVRLLS